MHICSVVGARPQFVKLAPFSAAIRARGHRETILHTGQHYDEGMSARFFQELGIPEPDINLGVGSGSHGEMTARALEGIERELLRRRPDAVVVFGDTNSTLAGALAAVKLGIPCVHVEAGLRSFDRSMPEEINRVVADHVCDLLLAPDETAMANLAREGLGERAELTGDIMVDAFLQALGRAPAETVLRRRFGLGEGPFALLTVHRAANTDDPRRLAAIVAGLRGGPLVLFPVHPRTRAALARDGLRLPENVRAVDPVGYLEMVGLLRAAAAVVTDSGGLQKEAYLAGTPCITLRETTEWPATVELGWNILVGAEPERIRAALAAPPRGKERPPVFGDGHAAARMVELIERRFAPARPSASG
ncbi:MAG: UDP-N-acetylglucosamine 2-epimerase (non-hydrolyzing) [Chloroflexota bacterium]|nr:UDP-N-acetylglucosamine 2-epimerase (non-hydrolyzing) [Dehalococcoidia bacterium]MDW8046549.1 UDP-N-acetylglucosamine 2-epimerase (non-hydrolyzing) [Chloroflexota bacterium]